MSMESILVTVSPDRLREVQDLPVTPVHMTYRMGKGPHLFRVSGSAAPRGGFMFLDCRSFDGLGPTPPFCQEVLRECMARGFTGVVCDFESGRIPPLEQVVQELGNQCFRRSWTLLVPEQYGHCSPHAQVCISSALSGGTLVQRLREAQERFGRDRVVLALQRVAEDFFLPSPTGSGTPLTQEELAAFQTGFLRFVAGEYKRLGWVMQLHYGCRRNNNTRMFHKLGRDTGYDAVLQGTPSLEVAAFLDLLASQDALPRMVLYSLNPNDDEGLNSVIGCFQDGTPLGRIQQGSAWWFNDHKAGMVKQLTAFANGGLLGNFIGMLTDSRSFLSYPRHEYFRRILCELLGAWVENGEYPADWKALEKMVRGVCYNNAVEFFGFPLEKA